MSNRHSTLAGLFTDIANAIRTKKGESSSVTYIADNFDTAIASIDTDPSQDATLNSNDQLLSPYTAYSKGTKYTGAILTKTDSDITKDGATVTVPSGYYAQEYTKTIDNGSLASSSGSASLRGSNVVLTDTDNGISVTAAGSGEVIVGVSGYLQSGTSRTSGEGTTTKYISDVTVPDGTQFSVYNYGSTSILNSKTAYVQQSGTASSHTGSVYVNAWDSSSEGEMTGPVQVVSNGNWIVNTETPSTEVQGPYYGATTINAMPAGTLGTCSATKSISGNTATITPSVAAGTAGYNAHAAYSGSAVTVSASELVSGTMVASAKSSDENYEVTNAKYLYVYGVSQTNLSASNIKNGTTVTVSSNGTNIYSVTGTADTYDTVSSVPSTKTTDMIYNTTDSSYYLWED